MPRPTTLPALLASLPRATSTTTTPVLVRPASWPATSYYKVTRSTLKFRPASEVASSSTRLSPARLVGTSAAGQAEAKENAEGLEEGEGLEVGELKASGRVWGMLFWEGAFWFHLAMGWNVYESQTRKVEGLGR